MTDRVFLNYPLWISDFENSDKPELGGAWKEGKWKFWENKKHNSIDSSTYNFDVFNGTKTELASYVKKTLVAYNT